MEHVIEADPLADTLRSFIQEQPGREWSGRACELLDALTDKGRNKPRQFPSNPHTLSGHLRQVSTFLRKLGIEIEFYKDTRTGRRIIQISVLGSAGSEKQGAETTRAINSAKTERFTSSSTNASVTPEASESSPIDDKKRPVTRHFLSIRRHRQHTARSLVYHRQPSKRR